MGVGGGVLTWPYPLNVQSCPPRDQRRALRSKVLGQIAQCNAIRFQRAHSEQAVIAHACHGYILQILTGLPDGS